MEHMFTSAVMPKAWPGMSTELSTPLLKSRYMLRLNCNFLLTDKFGISCLLILTGPLSLLCGW